MERMEAEAEYRQRKHPSGMWKAWLQHMGHTVGAPELVLVEKH